MAANVDLVLVVCGLDRPVRGGRIQRTITIALDAGAESLVVLTKADKVGPEVAAEAEMIAAEVDPALEVVTLSAKGGWGIDDLLERVGTRTVALIGESGAGKSTLVNALMEGDVAAEGDVREGDSKGRHTTTHRELHLLDGGGILVDTPGIREVGIWTDTDAVAESFPEIEELAEQLPVPRLRPRDRARLRRAGRGEGRDAAGRAPRGVACARRRGGVGRAARRRRGVPPPQPPVRPHRPRGPAAEGRAAQPPLTRPRTT